MFSKFMVAIGLAGLLVMVSPVAAQSSFYGEAPMLAEQVANGDLPVVDERMPLNPMLVQPVEAVGVYGGTWRMAMRSEMDLPLLVRTVGYENLVRWDEQWTRIIPNIAQSFEANADATEFRFTLREGMRWSDGMPFTADDILFWYEAVFSNPELTSSPPSWLRSETGPVVVEKVDATTVIFRFPSPNSLFLQNLAHPSGGEVTAYPRHYLEQFHVDYNPEAAAMALEAGYEDWAAQFLDRIQSLSGRMALPDLPNLNAWHISPSYNDDDLVVTFDRNPYYWKIDTDFNQLPYIDTVQFTIVPDSDAILEMAIRGEIDMQSRRIPDEAYEAENMAAGGYEMFTTVQSNASDVALILNLTHPDPTLRTIFQNRDFRVALSHAINRDALRGDEAGLNAYQVAPLPNSAFFNEQLAYQYLDYDVALANELLDGVGLTERNADGIRLRPDGEPLHFNITVPENQSSKSEILDMVQADWRAVGIDMSYEVLPRDEAEEFAEDNNHDAIIWTGVGGLDVILDARYFLPYTTSAHYAVPWARWYSDPNDPQAEVPPEAVQEQFVLYRSLMATADEAEQRQIMGEILAIAADQFYVIGTNTLPNDQGVVRTNFHNVPSLMPDAWTYPNPAPTNPSQYYIDPQDS
jgi:peptide/nickel transport system substrate-binding protein